MTTTAYPTKRFGTICVEEEDVIRLDQGLLGFPACTRYVVLCPDEEGPFRWLQSLDDGSLAFLVADPVHFVPDYAPEMAQSVANSLELQPDTPRLVYTIVTIPPGRPEEMSINLAGPIVINLVSRTARQVILEGDEYPIRHRPFRLSSCAA